MSWSNKEEPVSCLSSGGCLAIVRPWSDQEDWTFKPSLFLTFTLGTIQERKREREREIVLPCRFLALTDRAVGSRFYLDELWESSKSSGRLSIIGHVRGNGSTLWWNFILNKIAKELKIKKKRNKNYKERKESWKWRKTLERSSTLRTLDFLYFIVT